MNRFIGISNELEILVKTKKRFVSTKSLSRQNNKFSESKGATASNQSQIDDWLFLINHRIEPEIKDSLIRKNLVIQDINYYPALHANDVNLDFFAIKIKKLPLPVKSYEQMFNLIRLNLKYLTPGWANWIPYNNSDKTLWNSKNPVGTVMFLDFFIDSGIGVIDAPDNATVVCTSYSPKHWIFTTTRDDGGRDAGEHPVSGNRYFGYYVDKKDGSMVFFTRGADRKTWGILPGVFTLGAQVWKTLQKTTVSIINKRGGQAEIYKANQQFFTWNSVKPFTKYGKNKMIEKAINKAKKQVEQINK